jgi:predicted secreted protein
MSESASAGFKAKFYWATSELGAVNGDVNGSLSQAEIDVTTRGDAGWKNFIPGLKEMSITLNSIDPKDGTGAVTIAAMRTSFVAGTKAVAKMTDEDGNGWEFDCFITKFDWNQPFNGPLAYPVSLRVCGAPRLVGTGS